MSDTQSPGSVYPEWVTTESEKKLHDDFRAMVWLIWRHAVPGRVPPTPRQLKIAKYIQDGPPRRMVQAWRGAAKTWITCAYALWRLYRNPQERVKIVSANEEKAKENAVFMRRLIDEIEQLRFLRPRGTQRDSALAFDVGPADAHPTPSVSCVGINGQLTGGRATILISDDVEVPKNSFTETMREQLAVKVEEYESLVVPEGYDIIYLGTPQTEQSIYRSLPSRGYDVRIWPVRYPTPEEMDNYDGMLAPDLVEELERDPSLAGHSVEPTRFTDLDIETRENSQRSTFQLQFMLNTRLSDAERYPLKLNDLIVMDVDREMAPIKVVWSSDPRLAWTDIDNVGFKGDRLFRPMHVSSELAKFTGCVMFIDPSGRGKDETSYAVVKMLHGQMYCVASGGFTEGYTDATLQGLADIAKAHSVKHILIEKNYGDGMFTALLSPFLQRTYPCTTEEVHSVGQKERRIIDTLEPVLNQHRLVLDASVARADIATGDPRYSLLYQLSHITADRNSLRHDDRVEALAGAVAYWVNQLAKDQTQVEREHKEKLMDEELKRFIKHATGRTLRNNKKYTSVASGVFGPKSKRSALKRLARR